LIEPFRGRKIDAEQGECMMDRRDILKGGLGSIAFGMTGASVMLSRTARAAEWPTKPIRVIVPYGPGSATDLIPRLVFEAVAAAFKQTIIVENRPAGGTTVGTNAVAKSDPDGHTILVHSNAIVTVPAIQPNVPYDPVKDFSGVTPLGNVPLVLVVSPEKKIKTVQELIAMAKAKPGSINYAAAGIGTPPHLATERFRLAANFEGQLIPFKSSPEGLTEVLAGRVDFYLCPIAPAMPLVREGKLLALAVSSSKRALALPDVPTTVEAGVADSNFDFWVGAFVPKQTPREVVAKLNAEIVSAAESPSVKEKLGTMGVEPLTMKPEDFDARIAKEADIAVKLAKAAKISMQ
jgi:tripartite-type tricarboxylate transporter receptor subunit TctC